MRPAAEEWDEREEFPWLLVEEAAKIGLYSFDFAQASLGDDTGLTLPIALEELFWGDAGIGLAIFGSAWRRPASPAPAPPSRSWSGYRSASARPRRCSSAALRPSPTPAPTCRR